ncbi:hypothetical protein A3H16_00480 [Candidatus Kaiserbacteria bacterium RIFCSPLOWO2_12_FULL_53_8]|uniref:Uncharacterized protein n=2 Tax=Candidatus Kaiseribacteriota TaxID=1752734 RepID=A0A1F6CXY2_9BACT|nr:MAG: hypothetical protein A2851_03380 [Candidatus Kaiserbacteria bacterium RIFCSPHIGHO2_01_FULL_53_29]OGG92120.1 MAG: hypothetical protein A3H16_00480 [Candidatus Kaiserbacteria bacterium RIFCSPLOWO2_12_FULL_53_8]
MHRFVSTSLLSLLAVNIGVIVFAVKDEWSPPTILATYWLQSVIIGIFQAKKMSGLQKFRTDGLKINEQPVAPVASTRRKVVRFFLFHYGLFHVVYLSFLFTYAGAPDFVGVLTAGAAFFANHLFSYYENHERDLRHVPNIGGMMFFPYIRIIPMHLFVVLGAIVIPTTAGLVFFLTLKTLADAAMHMIEHYGDTNTLRSSGRFY